MNYRHKLQYLLVHKLGISHKEAALAIERGEVEIDGQIVYENCLCGPYLHIKFRDEDVQNPAAFRYFAYHKPRGVECTLNPEITDSLYSLLPPDHTDLFYAGRLDKASEGLLLLTNDGHVYNKIIHPAHEIEKYYEVRLEKDHTPDFIAKMQAGVDILGTTTLPCVLEPVGSNQFNIILKQGLNRQIRRMSFALGNYVTELKRTQIGQIALKDLKQGAYRELSLEEIQWLRNL